jgi:hypothetical protein
MKIVLTAVAVALTMLSCTTPTPTPETTQPNSSTFSHSGPGERASWEAGRAWQKEHMKTGAMSRL